MPRRRDVGRSAGRWALCARAMLIAVIGAGLAAAVPAAAEEQPTYRLFLLDDTPLVSYSEITHVGGRAVFTVPLGSASDPAALRVVSLPERLVDWERTNRYSDAVRLRRYATTRGDDDYKALTEFLARAMSDMAFSTDPAEKLRIGGDARRKLAEWPAAHFGFRELEVRELTAILEEAISDVQASAGALQFNLNLVATVERTGAPLLLEPTPEEVAASAAVAARLSDNRVERMSLQQSILLALAQRRFSAAEPWIRTTERDVRAELDADLRMDRQYAALVSKSIRKAAEYAATGNVGRLEKLIADVRTSDAQLGHRRPDELQALDASLADAIEIARSTRMSLDRWQFRVETYGDYRGKVDSSVKRLAEVTPDIEAVRALAGPDPRRLPKLEDRITTIAVALLPLSPPSELREAHDALRTSLDLMRDAARLRRQAFSSGSMETAYNASAAAAGALMLLQNATTRIDDYFRRPFQP